MRSAIRQCNCSKTAPTKAVIRCNLSQLLFCQSHTKGLHSVRKLTITSARSSSPEAEEADDEDVAVPGRPMRVERLLANLGYGKRKDTQTLVKKGRVLKADGSRLKVGDKVLHHEIMLDGEPLDPPQPLTILLNKPTGYVVTSPEDERITDPKIYDLLPFRFGSRKPFLGAIGRLDKDTSGLLILTDDGQLAHKVKSPKHHVWKVYEAKLSQPLTSKQVATACKRFASGKLILQGDTVPLLPAALTMIDDSTARLCICEGRYHQVRRMFAALGHEVVALHRSAVGGLHLDNLPEGEWRIMGPADIDAVFAGPTTDEVMGAPASKTGPVINHTAPALPVVDTHPQQAGTQEVNMSLQASTPATTTNLEDSDTDLQAEHTNDIDMQIASRQEQQVAQLSTEVKAYSDQGRRLRRRETLQKMLPG